MKRAIPLIAGAMLLAPLCLHADELKLKDGSKITGTIVGFEENSFKVKTSYGYAVVQKDQVLSISMTDTAKKPDATKSSDSAKKLEPGAQKLVSAAKSSRTDAASASATAAESKVAPNRPNITANAQLANTSSPTAPASTTTVAPPKPAAPEPIREQVAGNSYVNETYGFRMYKPPDWQLIAGARTLLPGTITAMGTGDQTTYLLIGQDAAGKSLAGDMNATEQRLREVMENFRPLGEKRITVSGGEAIERIFRGSVDEHDWSGTVVLVPRGSKVYTIFGMTYADSDLVQIQENVIARAIASLQFTKP